MQSKNYRPYHGGYPTPVEFFINVMVQNAAANAKRFAKEFVGALCKVYIPGTLREGVFDD